MQVNSMLLRSLASLILCITPSVTTSVTTYLTKLARVFDGETLHRGTSLVESEIDHTPSS